jgi:hypothetical protein
MEMNDKALKKMFSLRDRYWNHFVWLVSWLVS